MIEVEIKGHYGQFIKGCLRRIVEDKGVIVYADDPNTEETIPLSELRLPPKDSSESLTLAPNQHVEALLPLNLKDDQRENGFADALAGLKLQPTTATSRLANPLACLTCPSWWPCVVTKFRDDHAVVQLRPVLPEPSNGAPKEYTELAASLSNMTEICQRKILRPVSGDVPCLRPEDFFTHKLDIPPELFPYASDPAVHEIMSQHCNGPASIVLENGEVTILSPSEEVIRVARLLEEMHVRMLRQKHSILKYINQTKRTDPLFGGRDGQPLSSTDANTWSSDEGHFVECFQVPSSLMGLAIGTQGSNIRAARSIAGVIRIEVKEPMPPRNGGPGWAANGETPAEDELMASFKVVAETEEAAKAARAALEYYELCLLVPHRLIGRILGMRTTNILAINEKSGVKHIHLEENSNKLPTKVDPVSPDSDHLPSCLRVEDIHPHLAAPFEQGMEGGFFIVGTRESVEKARILITFQIDYIFDLEKLEAEKIDLLRELPQREARQPDSEPRENAPFQGGPRRGGRGGGGRGAGGRFRDGGEGGHPQSAGEGSGDPGEELGAGPQGYGRGQFGGRGARRPMDGQGYRGRWVGGGSGGPPRFSGDTLDNEHDHQDQKQARPSDGEMSGGDRRGGMNKRHRGPGHAGGRRAPASSYSKDEAEVNGAGCEEEVNGNESGKNSSGHAVEQPKSEKAEAAVPVAAGETASVEGQAVEGAKANTRRKSQKK
ncbi:RNA-binding protein fxr1 [Sparganum proliferum]